MVLFLISFLVIGVAILAMSVGVILANKRLQGSCGGLSALGIEKVCDCPRPCERRRKALAARGARDETQVIRFR